jgi:integrase
MKFYLHHYSSQSGRKIMLELHNKKIGGRFVWSTGITIDPSMWDAHKNYIRIKSKKAEDIHSKLQALKEDIESYLASDTLITKNGLVAFLKNRETDIINPLVEELTSDDLSLLDWYQKYLDIKFSKLANGTYRGYKNSRKNLQDFLREKSALTIRPNSLSYLFIQEFESWLHTHYAPNSAAKQIKHIVMVLKFIQKNGIKLKLNLEDITYRETSGRKISLTFNQIKQLKELELTDRLDRMRDLMLIQCSTGMRVSDLFRISKNISNGKLAMQQQKTRKRVEIPLSKTVLDILKKYEGNPPVYSAKEYREGIKEVYKLIDDKSTIQIAEVKNGKAEFVTKFTWQEISSHDMVRTFITVSAERGMSVPDIAKIVGKSEQVIYKHYLNISQERAEKELMRAWDF